MAFDSFIQQEAADGKWCIAYFDGEPAVKLFFSEGHDLPLQHPLAFFWRGHSTEESIRRFLDTLPSYENTLNQYDGINWRLEGRVDGQESLDIWATLNPRESKLTPEVGFLLEAHKLYDSSFREASATFFRETFIYPNANLDDANELLEKVVLAVESSYPNIKTESDNLLGL